MSDSIDLRKLWGQQKSTPPSIAELFKTAKEFKSARINKLIVLNVVLLLSVAFMGSIWFYFQTELWTTKVGISLMVLAMLLFFAAYNTAIPLLIKIGEDLNSKQYLQQLLQLKEKQRYLQTTMLNIYFLLLSLGIGLYMYEFVARMPIIWGGLAYALVLVWMLVNWFYWRPKTIAKQEKEINELINKFKTLEEQITAD